jgi:acyl-CoA dehydrogenase
MAITEPGSGSDSGSIQTTAVLEGEEWVLNGEKIFVTAGKRSVEESEGFVVVWATVDRKAGRAGIKPFLVDHHTPGMTVTKLEKKHGIRCSDTAVMVFENCRIPKANLLGSAEVKPSASAAGFKGAMATFDATRPPVAASAVGVVPSLVAMISLPPGVKLPNAWALLSPLWPNRLKLLLLIVPGK